MIRASFLALAASALAPFAGCGERPNSADPPAGRLVIRESLPPMPRYIEGSLSFLRVTRGGEVLTDGPATDGRQVRGDDPLFSRAVEPGDYQVVSWQRPCDGNCSLLDPAVDRCEATVHVRPGETLTATIVLAQRGGCDVRL